MAKEIFSTMELRCSGRKIVNDGDKNEKYLTVLRQPVHALITTFRDTTREVCCPLYHDQYGCMAQGTVDHSEETNRAESVIDVENNSSYAPCAFDNRRNEANRGIKD